MLLPTPPEYPETRGELADAVQLNIVPVVAEENSVAKISPEQIDPEDGLVVIIGVGFTFTA